MQATSVFGKTSSVSSLDAAKSPVSGAINGRQAISTPAASPRICCHSPWWSALWQGGFKGWHKWLVRTQEDKQLSVQQRQDRPRQAEASIGLALAQAASNKEIDAPAFNRLIKDVRWYGVDVDQVIHSAFLTSKQDSLEKLKSACDGKNTLGWLVRKIDSKLEELKALEANLKDGIYKSVTLSAEGFAVNGYSQKGVWEEMDRSFDSVGNCHLEGHVAFALSKAGAWNLLPYAELQFKSVATTSKVLEQVCIQAWKNISTAKAINFSMLTDRELARFRVLVKHDALKHHAPACNAEWKRRAHNAKCERLAAHLEKRAQEIATSSSGTPRTNARASGGDVFEGFSEKEISSIALRVIVKLNSSDVVKLSKLQAATLTDMWLNEIAKAQLENPGVTLMEDAVVIDYLQSAEDGKLRELSADACDQLEAEAGKRARKAYEESYARLETGLQSDSCSELVRATLEFSARFKLAGQLDKVSSLEEGRAKPPASFVETVKKLKDHQKIRARNLVLKLRELGQNEAADHLSAVIRTLRGTALVQLNTREEQQISDALSQYVPAASDPVPRTPATLTGIELGKKFLGLFNDYILNDDDFRMVRNIEDGELPVSAQFVMDQRSSDLQVEGQPVFIQHIPFPTTKDTRRAQEFVKRMRAVKGISDDQIMSASRIASQCTGAVLGLLARNEKLFSLTDDEAVAAQVGSARPGLMVSGIDHKESFALNRDGSLTVNARLFKENASLWSGGSSSPGRNDLTSVTTDPARSSFSAELRFEIDQKGRIREVVFVKSALERADARKIDESYGAA